LGYTTPISQYYEQLIRKRQSGVPDELLPSSHIVNWDDAPYKLTIFRDATRVPLCPRLTSARLDDWIGCQDRRDSASPPRATIDVVSDLLLLGAGILGRRAGIDWNAIAPVSSSNIKTPYFRGPASGGGLYPTEVYLVAQNIDGLPSGVYHYDSAHHALARLRMGNYQCIVKEACNHPGAESADFLLIVTARFWKNLFKYYNFAFQVVTHDAGCLSDCFQQAAWRLGLSATTMYWFKDSLLVDMLGLTSDEEAVCAVIAASGEQALHPGPGPLNRAAMQPDVWPNISPTRFERSQNVFLPELLRAVHRATLLDGERRPESDLLPEWEAPSGETRANFDLPSGCNLPSGFTEALVRRKTSFGRFRRDPPLSQKEIAQLLCFVSCSARHSTDIYTSPRGPTAVRLCLIARNVSGLPPGTYDHNPRLRQLILKDGGAIDSHLQKYYFLDNYNLDQMAAIVVVVGRLQSVVTAWGNRGLRIMNAESGMVAQRCYVAASALGLGCGAALGFDATQINRLVGVDGESESSILLMFIGHQVPAAYAYDFRLY